jgi:hypothetical protein
VLTQPDLEDLHLALDDAAPKVFNVKVAVLAPAGVATVGSILHVRVVDAAAQDVAANGATEAATADSMQSAPAPASPAAQAPIAPGSERTTGAPVRKHTAAPASGVTEVAPVVGSGRSWPEGATGLGAVSREGERQVWWEVPPPSWSPFQDGQGRP